MTVHFDQFSKISSNNEKSFRVQRVENEIRDILAEFLQKEFHNPVRGFISISRVLMPADLRSAKIYISVFGVDALEADQVIESLDFDRKSIQKYLGKKLSLRYLPTLKFIQDTSTEKILKIENIIKGFQSSDSIENNVLNSKLNT